jgi:hypothetical protein
MVEPEATGRRLDGAIAIGTKLGVLACGPVAGIFRVRSGSLHVNDGKYVDAVVLIVLAIIVVEVLGEVARTPTVEKSAKSIGAERVMLASGQVSALVNAYLRVRQHRCRTALHYYGDRECDKTDDDLGLPGQNNDLIGFSGKPSENSLNMNVRHGLRWCFGC